MARSGEDPARIWPVIIPGSCTSPTVIIPLTTGIIAARSAERISGCTASRPEKPRARRVSTSAARTRSSPCRRSPARAALVIELPRINDRDDVLRLIPRTHLYDDADHVGQRRARRDEEGDGSDPVGTGNRLREA